MKRWHVALLVLGFCITGVACVCTRETAPVILPTAPRTADLSLSMGRDQFGAAVIDGKIYLVGGYCSLPRSFLALTEALDLATGTWKRCAGIPTPLAGHAVAPVGGKLYVFGGSEGHQDLDTVYAYDPATDTWKSRAPLPFPRDGMAAVELDGKIFVIGGMGERNGRNTNLTEVTVYDPADNFWRACAPMPTARGSAAAAAIDGKIYVAGGGRDGDFLDALEVYDPKTDTWEKLTPMPTPRTIAMGAALDGKLLVIGGLYRPGALASTSRYHTATEVRYLDLVDQTLATVSTVEAYDPATNRWEELAPISRPRQRAAAVAVGYRVWLLGGCGLTGATLDLVETYVPAPGTGQPAPREQFSATGAIERVP